MSLSAIALTDVNPTSAAQLISASIKACGVNPSAEVLLDRAIQTAEALKGSRNLTGPECKAAVTEAINAWAAEQPANATLQLLKQIAPLAIDGVVAASKPLEQKAEAAVKNVLSTLPQPLTSEVLLPALPALFHAALAHDAVGAAQVVLRILRDVPTAQPYMPAITAVLNLLSSKQAAVFASSVAASCLPFLCSKKA